MRATAIRCISEFVPEDEIPERTYVIGAHADHRREDFIFPRTQSRAMRETPWASRGRPLRSWSELIGTGLVLSLASVVLILSTVLI